MQVQKSETWEQFSTRRIRRKSQPWLMISVRHWITNTTSEEFQLENRRNRKSHQATAVLEESFSPDEYERFMIRQRDRASRARMALVRATELMSRTQLLVERSLKSGPQ